MSTSETIPIPHSDYFHVSVAFLCEDCQMVHNNSQQCPACASKAIVGLAGILNRDTEPGEQEDSAG